MRDITEMPKLWVAELPRPQVVFIVAQDYGYEGLSEPLGVFVSRHLADIFVAGMNAGHSTPKVFEMPVISGASPIQAEIEERAK